MKRILVAVRQHWLGLGCVGVLCLINASCSGNAPEPENPQKVVSITGKLLLDGEPGYGVHFDLNIKDPSKVENLTYSSGKVDEDGSLIISTYGRGDGAPPGEYILTFTHPDQSKRGLGVDELPDLLGGKYRSLSTSEHSITVPEEDETVDIGTIELTSP